MKFLNFSIFVGPFCPPGSGSGFRIWIQIQIQWPDWIRIESGYESGPETLASRKEMHKQRRRIKNGDVVVKHLNTNQLENRVVVKDIGATGEYWWYIKDQAFSPSYYLAPPPPLPSFHVSKLSQSSCVSSPVELTDRRGGECGRSQTRE